MVGGWCPCVVSFHGRRIVDKIHHHHRRAPNKVMVLRFEHRARERRQTGRLLAAFRLLRQLQQLARELSADLALGLLGRIVNIIGHD